MKIVDAAKKGISRLRRPMWVNLESYVKVDIFSGGRIGPWLHLYDRPIQEMLNDPTPQPILSVGDDTEDWEEYTGLLDAEDK